MTRLETILKEAESLSPSELELLITYLRAQIRDDGDDESVGRRGLAALTESTSAEDWSGFYPKSLKNGRSADV